MKISNTKFRKKLKRYNLPNHARELTFSCYRKYPYFDDPIACSIFIDLLLIGKIRPSYLHIPLETTIKTMKLHVIKTFTIGWIFIIPIILISSVISYFILK